ncbi:MAG: 5-bromo-4-chloroindolyl phosphate hydrolysis family protein [Pseudomonadota bacterium]
MSAKRFGGAHSPSGDPTEQSASNPSQWNKFSGRKAKSVDVRTILMFVLPTPLLFAAIGAMGGSNAVSLIGFLSAYVLMMLGAWLLREGQRAAAAYEERAIARAPAFPRKLCAAALAGVGVFLGQLIASAPDGVFSAAASLVQSGVFGVIAAVVHVLAFGIDPLKSKGLSASFHQAELDRVTEAVERAEEKLKNIEQHARKVRDSEVTERVTRLNATVRDMISLVERDPRDLSRARRYLGVYLKGAEEATRKYAENHARLNDPKIRSDYMALLTDLEASFSRGRETLLLDDRTDLEVEIEVLRDRLGQESA